MSQVGDSDRNVSTSPSFSWWQRAAFSLLRLPLALLLLVLGDLQHLLLPVIDRIFPFEQAKEALAYLEQGHARGKVVVRIN